MKNFDPEWYAATYPDVVLSGLNPETHFSIIGSLLGRLPRMPSDSDEPSFPARHARVSETCLSADGSRNPSNNSQLQRGIIAPLVSILIINLNGRDHIAPLAASIRCQTYKNLETIFLDNGSVDDSVDLAESLIPNVKIVRCSANHGFAEANNIALENATGELVFLLNNDTVLDELAIEKLVEVLSIDSGCAAVAPKIRFLGEFVRIVIRCDQPFCISRKHLIDSCRPYRKIIECGSLTEQSAEKVFYVPKQESPIEIRPLFASAYTSPEVTVTVEGMVSFTKKITSSNELVEIDLRGASGRYLINNAGSVVDLDGGNASDRGYGEEDHGQYDASSFADAFCGCAVLIRRRALGMQPLFAPDFFAYYEDTELSVRLRRAGYSIRYEPASLVYHKHSSTSVEGSAKFKFLVERNRLLFLGFHAPAKADVEVKECLLKWNHWIQNNNEEVFPDKNQRDFVAMLPGLSVEIEGLVDRAKRGLGLYRRSTVLRIGIYNEYWSTLGGGELRALHLAMYLRRFGIVDLISSRTFDFEKLSRRFNLNLDGIRPLIVDGFNSENTRAFDLFVNTTHHSNLECRARRGVFLLSFPHKHITRTALESYDVVLANSRFTHEWVCRYWGPSVNSQVLYPAVIPGENGVAGFAEPKQRAVLAIGRFFPNGHCKCQKEIVNAFNRVVARHSQFGQWKLMLIGGCDFEDLASREYFESVCAAVAEASVEIIPNADRDTLESALRYAAIYVHATGLGNSAGDPEAYEHFGMSLVEAMHAGCVPLVFSGGGLPEVLGGESAAQCFASERELENALADLMDKYERNLSAFLHCSGKAALRANNFDLNAHNAKLDKIVADLWPEMQKAGQTAGLP